jgi:hypothetical protein
VNFISLLLIIILKTSFLFPDGHVITRDKFQKKEQDIQTVTRRNMMTGAGTYQELAWLRYSL